MRLLTSLRMLWRALRRAGRRAPAPPAARAPDRITGPVRRDDRMHWYV